MASPFSGSSSDSAQVLHSYQRPPAAQGTFIRGSLFAPVPVFVKAHVGPGRWDEFLKRVDPSAATVLGGELIALAWYPFRVISSAVEVLEAMGKPNALQALAFHNLDFATRGIFRAIFKIGSPEFMLSRSDQVWQKYYSRGNMTVERAARGEARVRLDEFRDMTPSYSTAVLHSMEAVIVKAGGRIKVAETVKDISRGDRYSEYHYQWT